MSSIRANIRANRGTLETVRKNTFRRAEGSTHPLRVPRGTGFDPPKISSPGGATHSIVSRPSKTYYFFGLPTVAYQSRPGTERPFGPDYATSKLTHRIEKILLMVQQVDDIGLDMSSLSLEKSSILQELATKLATIDIESLWKTRSDRDRLTLFAVAASLAKAASKA